MPKNGEKGRMGGESSGEVRMKGSNDEEKSCRWREKGRGDADRS